MKSFSLKSAYEQSERLQYHKIQFYATLSMQYTNKLFSFKVTAMRDCWNVLYKFLKAGNKIKAIFLIYVNPETGEILNMQAPPEFIIPVHHELRKRGINFHL